MKDIQTYHTNNINGGITLDRWLEALIEKPQRGSKRYRLNYNVLKTNVGGGIWCYSKLSWIICQHTTRDAIIVVYVLISCGCIQPTHI